MKKVFRYLEKTGIGEQEDWVRLEIYREIFPTIESIIIKNGKMYVVKCVIYDFDKLEIIFNLVKQN